MQEKWHRAVEDAPEPNGHGIATGMRSLFDVLVYVVQWGVRKFTHDCFLIYNYYCRDDLVLRNTVKNYSCTVFI